MGFAEGDRVWHGVYGLGSFRKYHKNGRASVQFEGFLLPKSVNVEKLQLWETVLTGSDYE